jgi:dolichol-phosphate mannosyltransferase
MNYKKLSIIVPVFNEESTIMRILNKLECLEIPLQKEIVIVDDYSTDGTRALLKDLEDKYTIIYHKKNGGKGRALRTGFKHATGEIITIQDADLEYDPNDYNKMLPSILKGKTKVVYGSRFIGTNFFSRNKWFSPTHYIGNKLLSLITSLLYFRRITDMETCYKMFDKEVLKKIKLQAKRFDIEPEITAKIIRGGYKIKEIPINYYPRGFHDGKKITWRDGIHAFFYLLKYRFIR